MEMSPKDELKRAHRQATFIGMAMISSLIIYVIILFRSVNISTLFFASRRLKFYMFFMEAWNGLEEGRFHGACKGGGGVYQWKGGERVYARFLSQ